MNEENIIQYLQKHPEFVHKIQLNFSKGQTSSLVEKRIANLTDDNNRLKKSLNEHILVSKQNVALSERVHKFTLSMFTIKSLDSFTNYLTNDFKDLFLFDEVIIYSKKQLTDNLNKYLQKDKIFFGETKKFNLNDSLKNSIQTVAIINLNNFLLLIGSNNKTRFTPDMDQFFISNIQQIMNLKLNEFNQ